MVLQILPWQIGCGDYILPSGCAHVPYFMDAFLICEIYCTLSLLQHKTSLHHKTDVFCCDGYDFFQILPAEKRSPYNNVDTSFFDFG